MSHGELRASQGYPRLRPPQPRYKAFRAGEPRSLQLEAAGCASGLHRLLGKLNHLSIGQTWVQVQALADWHKWGYITEWDLLHRIVRKTRCQALAGCLALRRCSMI